MPFSTLLQPYIGSKNINSCFPLYSTLPNILFKPLTTFPHNDHQNNGQNSGETGMNPVAITIINPQQEGHDGPVSLHWPNLTQGL